MSQRIRFSHARPQRAPAPRRRRGFSAVMATFYVALFSGLAVAYTAFTGLNSAISGNTRDEQLAYAAAESGLSVIRFHIGRARFDAQATSEEIFAALGAELADAFNGTLNLSGGSVSVSETSIQVPEIALDDAMPGAAFSAALTRSGDTHYVTVTGRFRDIRRTVRIAFAEQDGPAANLIMLHGVASQGALRFDGAATMRSNIIGGGSVMSMDPTALLPVRVNGAGQFDGDIYMVKEGVTAGDVFSSTGTVFLKADGSGYESDLEAHTHSGVPEPAWPGVNTEPFRDLINALPHQRIDSGTNMGSLGPLHNLYIAAGANPTFNSGVTITGLVYVEWPNSIKFSGSATITGMIVCQPPPYEPAITDAANCSITFSGAVNSSGPGELPQTAEYQGLHEHTGTFVLAPDYNVTFNGAMGNLHGTLYASELNLNGKTSGTVYGAILVDRRRRFTKLDSVDLMFIVDPERDQWAGLTFDRQKVLVLVPASYEEL